MTCTSLEKIWDSFIKKLGNKKKEQKTGKMKNWLLFLKTINFKVMKTIR